MFAFPTVRNGATKGVQDKSGRNSRRPELRRGPISTKFSIIGQTDPPCESVEFVLTYEGRLPSGGNATQKQMIRRTLHPQLRELWTTHPALAASEYLQHPPAAGATSVIHPAAGFNFAPLICSELRLLGALDVLLLRPGPPGALIYSRADLDNQLKTLLDALRAPLGGKEIPSSDRPQPDEDPFFCLLDDDRRIVDLRLRAEQLLEPSASPSDVRALIHVAIKAEILTYGNMGLV